LKKDGKADQNQNVAEHMVNTTYESRGTSEKTAGANHSSEETNSSIMPNDITSKTTTSAKTGKNVQDISHKEDTMDHKMEHVMKMMADITTINSQLLQLVGFLIVGVFFNMDNGNPEINPEQYKTAIINHAETCGINFNDLWRQTTAAK
jgi:hypothetical protein